MVDTTVWVYKGAATPMAHIDPVFNLRFLENMGAVLYNKGYQMIELFILLQLIQVLTPGSNLINFYEDQKEVGVGTSISHKEGMIRSGVPRAPKSGGGHKLFPEKVKKKK